MMEKIEEITRKRNKGTVKCDNDHSEIQATISITTIHEQMQWFGATMLDILQ